MHFIALHKLIPMHTLMHTLILLAMMMTTKKMMKANKEKK